MIDKIKRRIGLYVKNLSGWSTKRKLLVFECDDWGGGRVPDQQAWKELVRLGILNEHNKPWRYDTLEDSKDFEELFSLLSSHKDFKGNPAIITAFTNPANPDFKKIKEHEFTTYFYEPFTQTLERYGRSSGTLSKIKEGIKLGVYEPQFHGREHVNFPFWIRKLGEKNTLLRKGFDLEFPYVKQNGLRKELSAFRSAFFFENEEDFHQLRLAISDGLNLFRNIFEQPAIVIDPPNGIFHSSYNEELSKSGIRNITTQRNRLEPSGGLDFGRSHYKTGQLSSEGQIYHIRNCQFEPLSRGVDFSIDFCLSSIAAAFRLNKPAIVSCHRQSFVGGIDPANRASGLEALNTLLLRIKNKWPEVEFISSGNLSKIMHSELNSMGK